jgi:hypothetical protein
VGKRQLPRGWMRIIENVDGCARPRGVGSSLGGDVSFDGTEYATGCGITRGLFEPPAAWTALQERERRQNEPPL